MMKESRTAGLSQTKKPDLRIGLCVSGWSSGWQQSAFHSACGTNLSARHMALSSPSPPPAAPLAFLAGATRNTPIEDSIELTLPPKHGASPPPPQQQTPSNKR